MRSPPMHELAICQGLLEQVEEIARRKGADRVLSVTVRIGPLAGVEPVLLQDAFGLAATGTSAATAALNIERTAVRVRCRECGEKTDARANCLICGRCGSWRTQVLEGEEMYLTRVELQSRTRVAQPDESAATGAIAAPALSGST